MIIIFNESNVEIKRDEIFKKNFHELEKVAIEIIQNEIMRKNNEK